MKFPSNLKVFDEVFETIHYCKCHFVAESYSLMAFNNQYVAQFSFGIRCITYFRTKITSNYTTGDDRIPHLELN